MLVQENTSVGDLLLQELSSDARDWLERDALVRAAMDKFRLALRSRPDFDRGCYNLGTVFYTFAMALQSDTGNNGLRCMFACCAQKVWPLHLQHQAQSRFHHAASPCTTCIF
jgi:hypothetical protein